MTKILEKFTGDNGITNTPQRHPCKNRRRRKKDFHKTWKIMYTNIRGMKGKKESLTEILCENEPQIFLLSETLLCSNAGTLIEGYTFYIERNSLQTRACKYNAA